MGFACFGVTHCERCLSPLKENEFGLCKECEKEISTESKEKIKDKKKEAQKAIEEKIKNREDNLEIFYDMDEFEREALKEFIHKIGKEYKKQYKLKQIEILQKEIEDEG